MASDHDEDDPFIVADEELTPPKVLVRRANKKEIPKEHQRSNDTRLQWLWSQRLIVVQQIKQFSPDVQDQMAATLVLSAAMLSYLPSIELLLQRLEGGAVADATIVEQDSMQV